MAKRIYKQALAQAYKDASILISDAELDINVNLINQFASPMLLTFPKLETKVIVDEQQNIHVSFLINDNDELIIAKFTSNNGRFIVFSDSSYRDEILNVSIDVLESTDVGAFLIQLLYHHKQLMLSSQFNDDKSYITPKMNVEKVIPILKQYKVDFFQSNLFISFSWSVIGDCFLKSNYFSDENIESLMNTIDDALITHHQCTKQYRKSEQNIGFNIQNNVVSFDFLKPLNLETINELKKQIMELQIR